MLGPRRPPEGCVCGVRLRSCGRPGERPRRGGRRAGWGWRRGPRGGGRDPHTLQRLSKALPSLGREVARAVGEPGEGPWPPVEGPRSCGAVGCRAPASTGSEAGWPQAAPSRGLAGPSRAAGPGSRGRGAIVPGAAMTPAGRGWRVRRGSGRRAPARPIPARRGGISEGFRFSRGTFRHSSPAVHRPRGEGEVDPSWRVPVLLPGIRCPSEVI